MLVLSSCEEPSQSGYVFDATGNLKGGEEFTRWRLASDSLYKKYFFFSHKKNIIGVIKTYKGKLEGMQYYFQLKPLCLVTAKRMTAGFEHGRYYSWRSNGTLEFICDLDSNRLCGKYFEFYDAKGYAPKSYREYLLYKGEPVYNGEVVFNPGTAQPLLNKSQWLPRVSLRDDTVRLGDSLHVTAYIRFPKKDYPCLVAQVDSAQVGADFIYTSETNHITFSVKTLRKGSYQLTGKLSPVRITSGSFSSGIFETDGERELRFVVPYVVE